MKTGINSLLIFSAAIYPTHVSRDEIKYFLKLFHANERPPILRARTTSSLNIVLLAVNRKVSNERIPFFSPFIGSRSYQ